MIAQHFELPDDPARRTAWTLAKMAELALAGVGDPDLMLRARTFALGKGARVNLARQAQNLLDEVRRRVRYVRDPIDVEALASPRLVLEHGHGDCDELATLLASLAMNVGIPARFVAATPDAGDAEWRHVWVELQIGDRWLAADPTHDSAPLGWAMPRQFQRIVVPLHDELAGLGMSGIFDKIFKTIKDITIRPLVQSHRWVWKHMGGDMRKLVGIVGPIVAGYFIPYFGATAAKAAMAILEGDRLKKKAKKALKKAQAAGIIPPEIDLNNRQHLEAIAAAGSMPAAERAAWDRAHGLAPAPSSSGSRGLDLERGILRGRRSAA